MSLPVNAESAALISGGPSDESIFACVTDSKVSSWSRSFIREVGAMTGSDRASSAPTSGSLTMSFIKVFIWERPSGVNGSPRKSSVTTLVSPESPNRSSILAIASVMALPSGSVAAVYGGGARCVTPAASKTVMIRITRSVMYGRAVTSQPIFSIILLIAYLPI